MILTLFSFLAGIVTILSPCILPILPIVLSSSLTGGKRRPFGVVSGFIISFSFFTLALTAIVRATGIPSDTLRDLSVVIIFVFGLSLVVPKFQVLWEKLASKLTSKAPQSSAENTGFVGGFWVGISLGLIWTPCVGPIMASVLTLAATSEVTLQAVIITLAYSMGTAIPMLAIIYGGRTLLNKVPALVRNTGKIQKVFGVILIILAIGIHFNWDRKFQTYILEKFPGYGEGITQLEDLSIVRGELDELKGRNDESLEVVDLDGSCRGTAGKAPGFELGGEWLGSDPLNLDELRGKVVLVDFWTYTCINCIRTLPFLKEWHDKYEDDGLVIVGVHTPEFEFEKVKENVEEAIEDFEIEYPVVQDNDFKIWRSYNNRYWPAKYLLDKNGCLRYSHFGEGKYQETEEKIQELLKESGSSPEDEISEVVDDFGESRTHETYLGYQRIENFASTGGILRDNANVYSARPDIPLHHVAFEGEWAIGPEGSKASKDASLLLNFQAKNVFLVMKPGAEGAKVRVLLDGEEIDDTRAGEDVNDSVVTLDEDRLYKLVEMTDYNNHLMRLEFIEGDVEVFAFTFG